MAMKTTTTTATTPTIPAVPGAGNLINAAIRHAGETRAVFEPWTAALIAAKLPKSQKTWDAAAKAAFGEFTTAIRKATGVAAETPDAEAWERAGVSASTYRAYIQSALRAWYHSTPKSPVAWRPGLFADPKYAAPWSTRTSTSGVVRTATPGAAGVTLNVDRKARKVEFTAGAKSPIVVTDISLLIEAISKDVERLKLALAYARAQGWIAASK